MTAFVGGVGGKVWVPHRHGVRMCVLSNNTFGMDAEKILMMNAEELAGRLESKKKRKALVLIDVREKGCEVGGTIATARQIPLSVIFSRMVNLYVDDFQSSEELVLFCEESRVRAPAGARAVLSALEERYPDKSIPVYVLKGGFLGFYHAFYKKPDLFRNLDPAQLPKSLDIT